MPVIKHPKETSLNNRTTTSLMTVIAVLLTLNILGVKLPTSVAQQETVAGPAGRVPVGITVVQGSDREFVYRLWSDGSVDRTRVDWVDNGGCFAEVNCPTEPVLSCCEADIDWSGDVGFNDLTNVLSNWGDCPPPEGEGN